MFRNKKIVVSIVLCVMFFNSFLPIFAVGNCKYCDLGTMYVGEDKFESFNRKMFTLNSKMNKFVVRPFHIIWTSIMPKFGMERIQNVYNNIEYPKRLASCVLQKDLEGIKSETKRFITNTTLGFGGLFDPAQKLFKLKPVSENMDQALCNCKMKSGHYIVLPILNSSCPRSLLGRILEAALDPSVYLASPIASIIKGAFVVNKTGFMQPVAKMVESTYADPYDIAKKMYGIESYIKAKDLDRKDLLSTDARLYEDKIIANTDYENIEEIMKQIKKIKDEESVLGGVEELTADGTFGAIYDLRPDIVLRDFKAQSPIVDSMRTALFDVPGINKSIWHELSIWNRSFAKRIKTDSVPVFPDREDYKFRYILQNDKNAPVAIFYPSVGEGINSHHSTVFAKIFFDAGYSVIIQGSHFQWEFAKSMPEGYCPGLPQQDADNLKLVTSKILNKLQEEHKKKFVDKILVGTSFGGMATLFVADKENKNNTLGISKFIAISPPIELVYAINQVDNNSEELNNDAFEVKHKIAMTAAKVIQITNQKNKSDYNFKELPFSEQEGKLITSYLMRQKLSDLVYTIENVDCKKKTDFYKKINNLTFKDYAEKYLLASSGELEDLRYDTSLYSIADYLKNGKNYKIYHSLDDFFINRKQLEKLKLYSPDSVICLNNGSHLGFLYRKEFIDAFKKDISISEAS